MADLVLFEEIALEVSRTGAVTAEDIVAIRRNVYPDETVSRLEAEGIYSIERVRRVGNREWTSFFIEVMSDHLINIPPVGYLSEDNAAWLETQVKRRKAPSMDGDVALVAAIIERAREVPPTFQAFGLRLVKEAVLYGDGPDGHGREHGAGRVTAPDVALLQRILWGAGREGQLAISREEAETLFAIADATTGAANEREFEDLFARAIGNYLMGATGRDVPPRETALRWETEGPYKANAVGMLGRVFEARFARGAVFERPRTLMEDVEAHRGEANLAREIASLKAEAIIPEKASWLVERINRNGMITPAEKALVRFVAREGGATNPLLKDLVARA